MFGKVSGQRHARPVKCCSGSTASRAHAIGSAHQCGRRILCSIVCRLSLWPRVSQPAKAAKRTHEPAPIIMILLTLAVSWFPRQLPQEARMRTAAQAAGVQCHSSVLWLPASQAQVVHVRSGSQRCSRGRSFRGTRPTRPRAALRSTMRLFAVPVAVVTWVLPSHRSGTPPGALRTCPTGTAWPEWQCDGLCPLRHGHFARAPVTSPPS